VRDMNREIFPTLPKRNNWRTEVCVELKEFKSYFEFKCHFISPHRPFSLKLLSNRKSEPSILFNAMAFQYLENSKHV
jgi:hypothetical protein